MIDPEQRSSLSSENISAAKSFIEDMDCIESLTNNMDATQWVFRFLRNSCINCTQNQTLIVQSHIVKSVRKFIDILFDPNLSSGDVDEKTVNELKLVLIQFLGNLVVHNKPAVRCVWNNLFPKHFFTMLSNLNDRGKDFLCMLLYNCLRDDFTLGADSDDEYWLMMSVLDHCREFVDVEWGLLVVELVLSSVHNFRVLYAKLIDYPAQRTTLLGILLGYLTEKIPEGLNIPEDNLVLLAKEFDTKSSCLMLLSTKSSTMDDEDVALECQHLYKLICVLSAATGHAKMFPQLRRSEALLQTSIKLLKEVCACTEPVVAGMTNSNSTTTTTEHPMFDVKRNLVKMVGNMCYENKRIQDATRELGGIPSLLNCCVIDDRNPYLMQWAIFAVRTVCEGNVDNQKFIAGLENQGIVDNILNDTRVATRLENGKIRLCSIDEE